MAAIARTRGDASRGDASLGEVENKMAALSLSKTSPPVAGKTYTVRHMTPDMAKQLDEGVALLIQKKQLEAKQVELRQKIAIADEGIAAADQKIAEARLMQAQGRQMQAESQQRQAESRQRQADARNNASEAHEKLFGVLDKVSNHLISKKAIVQKIIPNPQDKTRVDLIQKLDGFISEVSVLRQQHEQYVDMGNSMKQFDVRSKPILQQIALLERTVSNKQ